MKILDSVFKLIANLLENMCYSHVYEKKGGVSKCCYCGKIRRR